MNKKGISMGPNLMIIIAIGVVVLLVVIFIVPKYLFGAEKSFGDLAMQSRMELCKLKGARQKIFADNDFGPRKGDTYPDSCDFCLGGDDRLDILDPATGLPVNDVDNDGIPNACDNFPRARTDKKLSIAKICNAAKLCTSKKCWKKETEQCVLTCYDPDNKKVYPCKPDGWK